MNAVKRFGLFWYDFIVGDDWRLAIGGIVTLTLVFAAAHNGVNAWWLAPLLVPLLLGISLRYASRTD